LIEHGATVNVKDYIGRTPLHFALYRTLQHVKLLCDEHGASLGEVDIMKRHALHFAVLSGRLNLVQYVLGKKPELADKADVHGWTPLLWALRVCGRWGTETSERKEIIEELLKYKARRLVRGEGLDRTWTPMMLAKYYSLSDDIVEVVRPLAEELKTEEGKSWDWMSGGSKRGPKYSDGAYCDGCLLVSASIRSRISTLLTDRCAC
jgi:ankyrin repeat protein